MTKCNLEVNHPNRMMMWQLYLEASLSSAAEALGEKDSFILTKVNIAAPAIGKSVFLFNPSAPYPSFKRVSFLGRPL